MGIKNIDYRAIFGFFTDPRTADRPTDKKEDHEIDSFKGNSSKNVEFQKILHKIVCLAGVLDPKMSKFYGTLGSRFPFTSIIRDGFPKSLVLARTRTQTCTNACNRARARDLFAITQACILVIAQYLFCFVLFC